MKLCDVDEITALRNYREKAIELRKAAASGPINCELWFEGQPLNPFAHISAEYVRQAIIDAATDAIIAYEKNIAEHGVYIPNPEPPFDGDAQSWRRNCEMYVRAWIRTLGGKLKPKTHLIDALVLTTEELRAVALSSPAEGER
jgi:hypothetical protein